MERFKVFEEVSLVRTPALSASRPLKKSMEEVGGVCLGGGGGEEGEEVFLFFISNLTVTPLMKLSPLG